MTTAAKVTGQLPWAKLRRLGARLTTPLDPDDYLSLLESAADGAK